MKKMISAILLTLGTVGLAIACQGRQTPEERAERIVSKIEHKLDLNEDQMKKLIALKNKALEVKRSFKNDRDQMHNEVKELVLSDSIEEEQIKNLLEAKKSQIDILLPQVLPEFIAFHSSLSREQKQKVVAFMEKFRSKRKESWHH